MEFLKTSIFSICIVLFSLVDAVFANYWAGIIQTRILSCISPKDYSMIENFVLDLVLVIFSIRIGMNWHKHIQPRNAFGIFLKKKIKQGERIMESELNDESKRRNLDVPDVVVTRLLDGTPREYISDSFMDLSAASEFRDCYSKWRFQVFNGVNFCLGKETAEIAFGNGAIPSPFAQYGNYRKSLMDDLTKLKLIRNPYSTAFEDNFKKEPYALKEFEEFKCPSVNIFHWKKRERKKR